MGSNTWTLCMSWIHVPPVGPGHSAALGDAVWESQRVRSWIFCGEHLFRLCDYLLHRLELFDDGHPSRLDGDTHRWRSSGGFWCARIHLRSGFHLGATDADLCLQHLLFEDARLEVEYLWLRGSFLASLWHYHDLSHRWQQWRQSELHEVGAAHEIAPNLATDACPEICTGA